MDRGTKGESPTFKKRQGFKGNCRICDKCGHKLGDCWEKEENQKKINKKKFQGKCKINDENINDDKVNVADDNEETVLMATGGRNKECTCKKNYQLKTKVKEAMQIEDVALGGAGYVMVYQMI